MNNFNIFLKKEYKEKNQIYVHYATLVPGRLHCSSLTFDEDIPWDCSR